jgi:hypothetical protein
MSLSLKICIFSAAVFATTFHDSLAVNESICNQKGVVYDNAGKVLKKTCFIKEGKTYDEAEKYCRNNGMQLYVVDSVEAEKGILKELARAMTTHFAHCNPQNFPDYQCIILINGRRSSNNKWYTYTHEILPLYENISWLRNSELGGDCLSMNIKNSKLNVYGESCMGSFVSFCEYGVTKPEATTTNVSLNQKMYQCQHELVCRNLQ